VTMRVEALATTGRGGASPGGRTNLFALHATEGSSLTKFNELLGGGPRLSLHGWKNAHNFGDDLANIAGTLRKKGRRVE